tara:strand:+ start:229 stop:1152 length:924 start_codon:yes stop_codon:yes gene_type:complete
MRYQEAYELIDVGIISGGIEIPITESLKSVYFDKAIEQIAMRSVQKKNTESFSTDGKAYTFTNEDYSGQVYKVELDQKDVPFVDESAIISNVEDDDVSQIGFYLKTDNSKTGIITGVSQASNAAITSASHNLTTDDYIIISEVNGATEQYTDDDIVNGRRGLVYVVGSNSFTMTPAVNTSGGYAYQSGGIWELDNKQIYLTKNPDSGATLKVFYYAKPLRKENVRSRIDLPDQLIPAAIHQTLGHFVNLGGNLQVGSGHMGLARKIEQEYIETSRAKEPMPHMVPNPMQSFVTTRNGSIGNLTGADD